MRIVFMGTPDFAAQILEGVIAEHDVIAVYTRQDKVRGRGKRLLPSIVKEVALANGIEVRTPKSLKDPDEQEALRTLAPDVICVAAYGMILPPEVLDIPRYGCINVHASLLPRWRGAAPIERAVLAGDAEIGVSIMRMEEGLDTGDYCLQESIEPLGRSAFELTGELADVGAALLLEALAQIEDGSVQWIAQDDALATYADKIGKGELDLDPAVSAAENVRRVLASSPAHPSKTALGDRTMVVLDAKVPDAAELALPGDNRMAGDVFATKKQLFLKASDGWIEIIELKPAGKNAMLASAYLAGARLEDSATWGTADA